MTPRLSDLTERISPEDIALAGYLLDEILTMVNCRTYAFYITSDMLTDSVTPLAIHAGKAIITRFIKGRKMRFCPHCNAKVFIRSKTKRRT